MLSFLYNIHISLTLYPSIYLHISIYLLVVTSYEVSKSIVAVCSIY